MRQVNPSLPYAKHPWPSTTPQISSAQTPKKVAIIIFGIMLVSILFSVIQVLHEESVFKRMSPADHLRKAEANLDFPAIAFRHLAAIPASAPEYKEVPALMKTAQDVEEEDRPRRQRIEAQEQRDSNASLSSYWPTTVRVDTDMDSLWLNGEERTCITTSGAKGRVAAVTCNDSGSHRTHNIPVEFWGGVDRNVGSAWRCLREGDSFACRALD